MRIEVDRNSTIVAQMEKKQVYYDNILHEWKNKVNDLAQELDASRKEARNYSTELFRTKALYEEQLEQIEIVRRENKNLCEEAKDIMEQINEGGRNIHELEKARQRIQVEKDELQAALEEAESAIEQEENKVLRVQLELSQVSFAKFMLIYCTFLAQHCNKLQKNSRDKRHLTAQSLHYS